MADFVHLHVHTEYSLLDGLCKIKGLVNKVKDFGMGSVAITDHGSMYGAIEFYKYATANGVKPIIGMEGYITNLSLTDSPSKATNKNYHLTLLAQNMEGYKNLMSIASIAHLKGFYYRPRMDWATLKEHGEGIVCLSGCPLGELGRTLVEKDAEMAQKVAERYLSIFGDRYYLEMMRFDSTGEMKREQDVIGAGLLKLSRQLGIPLVATSDVHYLNPEDAPIQDALVCISTGKKVADAKRMRYIDTPYFYLANSEEMIGRFRDLPEALENSLKIAQRIDLQIEIGKWYFPKFDLPDNKTPDVYLTETANQKLVKVFPKKTKELQSRLDHELDIINAKGYAPYFLIAMDLANWADEQGIVTNTRGSAAGSLVSFVLGITTVDPIAYYLPFERFLNPYRPSPPDIDFDVSDNRRDEIIHYIAQKYGVEKVAQICTFGRMLSRAAVRDVARVLGYQYAVGDMVSKLIPPPKQGFPITIPKAMQEVPELQHKYDSDADVKQIIDMAKKMEGNARHISVHAAGVVIAPTKITDFSPIQHEPKGEKVITQYEMHACEDVGLIKFDILGIRNLSILGAAIANVQKTQGIKINIKTIPLDDKTTFAMLGRGETMGTFQLGGGGMTKYLKELKPTRVEDLMAMVALYRPGPISVIPEYIKRKYNPKLVIYLDPRMEKFLQASYGLIVYQDDLLFCALDLAGYTWEEADKFRKAVGKKIPEEMAAQKDKFTTGIVNHGQTAEFAETLWKLFEPFQSYGFNKAHAASYGMVAYQTAYMKANYPVEYMTALLSAESDDKEKIAQAVAECKRISLTVLPPDVNESDEDFTIIDNQIPNLKAIRFGLSGVKNVGGAAISNIIEARSKGPFLSLNDFLERTDSQKINKRVLESLIKVGAMSTFGNRATLLEAINDIKRLKRANNPNQDSLFADTETQSSDNLTKYTQDEFSAEELEKHELDLLGFSLSARSITEILGKNVEMSDITISESGEEIYENKEIKIAGLIKNVKEIVTKKGNQRMAFMEIDDGTGILEVVVFPSLFAELSDRLVAGVPVLLSSKITRRDDEVSAIANKIEFLKKNVTVGLPANLSAEKLKGLKKLLKDNPGDTEVYIWLEESQESILFPTLVNWTKALEVQVTALLPSRGTFWNA